MARPRRCVSPSHGRFVLLVREGRVLARQRERVEPVADQVHSGDQKRERPPARSTMTAGSSTAVQTRRRSGPTVGMKTKSANQPLRPMDSQSTIQMPRSGMNAAQGFRRPRRRPITKTGKTRAQKTPTKWVCWRSTQENYDDGNSYADRKHQSNRGSSSARPSRA
jgi:hypothetical protein